MRRREYEGTSELPPPEANGQCLHRQSVHGTSESSTKVNQCCRESVASGGNPQLGCDIQPCPQPITCAIMVEAVTVGRSQLDAPPSPLFHGFWYLSSLTTGFCREFRANPMSPKIRGGG